MNDPEIEFALTLEAREKFRRPKEPRIYRGGDLGEVLKRAIGKDNYENLPYQDFFYGSCNVGFVLADLSEPGKERDIRSIGTLYRPG